jgi:hypothetical protein
MSKDTSRGMLASFFECACSGAVEGSSSRIASGVVVVLSKIALGCAEGWSEGLRTGCVCGDVVGVDRGGRFDAGVGRSWLVGEGLSVSGVVVLLRGGTLVVGIVDVRSGVRRGVGGMMW